MASPAGAWSIDYDLLFRQRTEDILRPGPDTERLELPGPVIVVRRSGQVTKAEDQGGWGAAGCAFDRLIQAGLVVRVCPERFDEQTRDRVAKQVLRAARFVAANTVPPVASEEVVPKLRTLLDQRQEAEAERLTAACADPNSPLSGFASHIASDAGLRRFDRIFAKPRLPVMQPCR